jgi:hypothetical protein
MLKEVIATPAKTTAVPIHSTNTTQSYLFLSIPMPYHASHDKQICNNIRSNNDAPDNSNFVRNIIVEFICFFAERLSPDFPKITHF